MTTRVVITPRVRNFLKSLAPEPRRKLWSAIKNLADGKGDVKQLDGKLARYWRLRADKMRVIFDQTAEDGERLVIFFFADHRATVYSVLEQLLASGLIEELKRS
jgi:mRNA-degrading endonuclease RelE of RelBE toxin-antitoxin system